MTENQFWKEGFLQKAGKHSFQGFRKRWVVLNSDSLKYYNPGKDYNDANLLGVIPLVEIQSLITIKSPKYGFEIITKSRTFSFSAKSDLERDDWIITIRKASDDKRDVNFSTRGSMASLQSYASSDSLAANESDHTFNAPEQKKTSKKKKKNSTKSNESNYSDVRKSQTPQDFENEHEKLRASSIKPMASEKEFDSKPRASSSSDTVIRAHSVLRKMSVREGSDDVAGIYLELDQELDSDEDGEESCDEVEDIAPTNAHEAELPPPRDGCKTYAFLEIKELLQVTDKQSDLDNADLKKIAKQHKLPYNVEEEFLAFSLLKSYMASLNK